MPGSSDIPRGNLEMIQMCYVPALTVPASIPASSSGQQSFTLKGVRLGDIVSMNVIGAVGGLVFNGSALITARDTVTVSFANVTTAAIAGAGPFTALAIVIRCSNVLEGGITQLPTAVQ
jgi:hypothetical protein